MNVLKLILILFWHSVLASFGFGQEYIRIDNLSSTTIGEVVGIFEIKDKNSVTLTLDNQIISIKVIEIVDSVNIDCSLADFSNNVEGTKKIRIHTYLQINKQKSLIKVSSKICGTLPYKNDNSDIQDIINRINNIRYISENLNDNQKYYTQEFKNMFDNGSIIEGTQFKIYLAKAFPFLYNRPSAKSQEYKFIFILTKIIKL
jgi:hypothetical protein